MPGDGALAPPVEFRKELITLGPQRTYLCGRLGELVLLQTVQGDALIDDDMLGQTIRLSMFEGRDETGEGLLNPTID